MPSGGRIITSSKKTGETVLVSFDFLSKLVSGETISTQSVAASVYSGVDANPSAIINGAATLSGTTIILQSITAGVVGCIYSLLCTITTSLGQTIQMSTLLAIEATTQGVP